MTFLPPVNLVEPRVAEQKRLPIKRNADLRTLSVAIDFR